ncbi:hypothetical protein CASFOL_032357 [Castilleja foliolosa]|uniref:Uncharacterized protein n=1 Tax=Castilleja foliolosa TaxID=1961234 RepID=A0ABD3C1A2_9LAMI
MPTAELRGNMSQASTKRSRRLRGVVPGEIPTVIPRSQSGPRHPTPLEQMNLVDEENIQSDADDEDYLPPGSVKMPSFIPDLTPDELESIAAASPQPAAKETPVGDGTPTSVALLPSPTKISDEVEILSPANLSPAAAPVDETSTFSAVLPPFANEIAENPAPSSPEILHTDCLGVEFS